MLFIKHTLLGLILVLSGCATFRDGANPPITNWPLNSGLKSKTISLHVICKMIKEKSAIEYVDSKLSKDWSDQVLHAYESSGYFSSVTTNSEPSDIQAEITVTYARNIDGGLGSGYLTGLTMLIIPAKERDGYTVKTTFKDKTGNPLVSVEKSEMSSTWIHLFLFPVTFAKFPTSVLNDILLDINKNTIIEAHAKGVF